MRVLITGAAGFLGSNVLRKLQSVGYEAIAFDVRQPECDAEYIKGDLRSFKDLLRATKGIDAVCHLGAVGDIYLAFEKPHLAAEVNVTGTANLMEACSVNKVERVVYASTWEVYDEPLYQPIDEDHPCNPSHPYGITKLAGEQIALFYGKFKGHKVISLRLGTAFGRNMRENSVFSLFIKRALNKEPITIQGTGEQYRQFTHASDIGKAFVLAIESSVEVGVFNIVNSKPVSIKELAVLVTDVIASEIKYDVARVGDISPALISSEKARKILGWVPQVDFKAGLMDLIDWHKERQLQPDAVVPVEAA